MDILTPLIQCHVTVCQRGGLEDCPILERHWLEVGQTLGDEDSVLILDGGDFLKQGCKSVGVKRHYWGKVGKRANCQAGVFPGYASSSGYTLLDRRLLLPNEWVEGNMFAEHRQKCGVPQDIAFKTEPQLGWEMIRAVVDHQVWKQIMICSRQALPRCRLFRRSCKR